jgi:hypothetical protein
MHLPFARPSFIKPVFGSVFLRLLYTLKIVFCRMHVHWHARYEYGMLD